MPELNSRVMLYIFVQRKTRPSALGMSDPVVVAWTSCRCPSCTCPPCHMGMSYLISLTPMLLRNIALDGLYWAVLGCTGLLWAVLGCTGQYWAVLGCIGLYWTVLGCTGL